MPFKSEGIKRFIIAKKPETTDADPPAERPMKGPPKEDPLKVCVLELLNQGGRSEEEARLWCQDYLNMQGKDNEPDSIDSANVREAERIMADARESLKITQLEQCIRNREALFGEPEYEAKKRCRDDWEMGERARGGPTTIATDTESRLRQQTWIPEAIYKLALLRVRLDSRTTELMNMCYVVNGQTHYNYTAEEADHKARKELGLPRVYPKPKPDVATVPDVTGKSRAQRIQESQAVNADKRPGERMIGPYSGVPNLYGKSRGQVLKEVFEQDAEDKR